MRTVMFAVFRLLTKLGNVAAIDPDLGNPEAAELFNHVAPRLPTE